MQFFLFLVIIFLAEIAFGVLIYFQEAPYPNVIRDSVEATVTKKYHNNSTATTQTFDLIQEGVSLSIISTIHTCLVMRENCGLKNFSNPLAIANKDFVVYTTVPFFGISGSRKDHKHIDGERRDADAPRFSALSVLSSTASARQWRFFTSSGSISFMSPNERSMTDLDLSP